MKAHNLFRLIPITLILLMAAAACKSEVKDSKQANAPKDSTTAKQELKQLPDSTNVELAKINRTPRSIRKGFYILIRKGQHQLSLYQDGVLFKTYQIAVGKGTGDKLKAGDQMTPEGHFDVKEIKDASLWTHDFEDGKGPVKAYGPYFISLNTTRAQTFNGEGWTGIGIHGTHDETSIGKNISAGCVRLKNAEVLELKNQISKGGSVQGIPVDILP